VLTVEEIEAYIQFAREYEEAQRSVDEDYTLYPTLTTTTISSLDFPHDSALSSATSFTPDPHAVSIAEAQSYYAGLQSEPTLLYRTSKEQWSPPKGPEAQRRLKELCEVFNHPITKVWNGDLAWKVVEIMDAHTVSYNNLSYRRVC
jgi:hypothetical protein